MCKIICICLSIIVLSFLISISSLASVEPPQVWFDLKFPEMVIEEVRLSALQLEAVVYACQQHMNLLADGSRSGFLIGKTYMKIHVPSMLAIGVDKHTQQTNKQPQWLR